MPDDAPHPDQLFARWLAAQDALLASDQSDWSSCAEMIRATRALGDGMCSGNMPEAGFLSAFPLALGPGVIPDNPRSRFAQADMRLKLLIAQIWAGAAERAGQRNVPPDQMIRRWTEALDDMHDEISSTSDYTAASVAWLEGAVSAGIPLTPPGRPAPPAPSLGTTPSSCIWSEDRVTLSRYRGRTGGCPLLIVHGLIGRQSVSDLEAGRSLVSELVAAGADLWVLDWGFADARHQEDGFTEHAEAWLGRAVDTVRRTTQTRPALFGICQGGLFVLGHAARHSDTLAGIVLTGTPVDFHADLAVREGYLNRLARALPEHVVDALIAPTGLLPGALTGMLFQAMTPGRTFAKYTIDLADKLADPKEIATFARMEAWLADRPDHPGRAAREWLIDLYQKNALVRGLFKIAGDPVRLDRITVPVLNIVAERD
ncbi:MAG: alpha/beta fold hydrolase, partial [Pseudomonadota bacterium]